MNVNWHRQHRWSGIVSCLLLAVFCISGIILNHREAADRVDVPRRLLPPFYAYDNWNGGLMRGTEPLGTDSIIIYGNGGMWLAGSDRRLRGGFTEGMPGRMSALNIRAVVSAPDQAMVWAVTPYAVYVRSYSGQKWRQVLAADGERLTDIALYADTVVALGRSNMYVSDNRGGTFVRIQLPPPAEGSVDGTTAFRVVWMLHSGELFGLPGRLVVDAVAVVMLVLCVTGAAIWLMPHTSHRLKVKGQLRVHKAVGMWSVVVVTMVVVTGWMLRPPLLVPLALWHVPEPSGTALDSRGNPWDDKLRMIRRDTVAGDWLLSTSHGFFSLSSLTSAPRPIPSGPPVSVMGLNVLERDPSDSKTWLCGSFSGMYRWTRANGGASTDWFTGEPARVKAGPPVGDHAVSGYTDDFGAPAVVLYDSGTKAVGQPDSLRYLPMPLWTAALEAHSGRIYFGPSATYFFVFMAGAIVLWCIYSGWRARRRR